MANDTLNARVSHMHDVELNWNKCTKFIPMIGEVLVYDADDTHPYQRVKIGDGKTTVVNLPFLVDATVEDILFGDGATGYIDAGRITDYN